MIGARRRPQELVALTDGYRESTESWADLLRDCARRGMRAPVLAIGDGALGFWGALREVFPQARTQRCWFHKIAACCGGRVGRRGLGSRGDVVGYRGRIDTAWVLSLERLSGANPAAVQLLELAAFLAPEPIPLSLIHNQAALLGEPLRTVAADPDAVADTVGALVEACAVIVPDGAVDTMPTSSAVMQ